METSGFPRIYGDCDISEALDSVELYVYTSVNPSGPAVELRSFRVIRLSNAAQLRSDVCSAICRKLFDSRFVWDH